MLASAKTIDAIADVLKEYNVNNIVLDPVCYLLAKYSPHLLKQSS